MRVVRLLFWPNYAKIMLVFFQIMPLCFKIALVEKHGNECKNRSTLISSASLLTSRVSLTYCGILDYSSFRKQSPYKQRRKLRAAINDQH